MTIKICISVLECSVLLMLIVGGVVVVVFGMDVNASLPHFRVTGKIRRNYGKSILMSSYRH